MAAASFTSIRPLRVPGSGRELVALFTPSTSYPALGEPLTAAFFGMQKIDAVIPASVNAPTTLHASWDSVNGKLRLYTSSTGAEVATGSNQSANKVVLFIIGL